MTIIDTTDETFEADVLKSTTPVLVDFWAPWCGPCRRQEPALKEIAEQYEFMGLVIAKVNIDENQQLPSTYNVKTIPCMLLVADGKVIAEQRQSAKADVLADMINKALTL